VPRGFAAIAKVQAIRHASALWLGSQPKRAYAMSTGRIAKSDAALVAVSRDATRRSSRYARSTSNKPARSDGARKSRKEGPQMVCSRKRGPEWKGFSGFSVGVLGGGVPLRASSCIWTPYQASSPLIPGM
jgi:hypothetical protein